MGGPDSAGAMQPYRQGPGLPLFGLSMQGVLTTARTEFLELNPVRVIPPILLGGVVPFLALGTG
jgi:hypothetical protein